MGTYPTLWMAFRNSNRVWSIYIPKIERRTSRTECITVCECVQRRGGGDEDIGTDITCPYYIVGVAGVEPEEYDETR